MEQKSRKRTLFANDFAHSQAIPDAITIDLHSQCL